MKDLTLLVISLLLTYGSVYFLKLILIYISKKFKKDETR